jgi:hypothetical protein
LCDGSASVTKTTRFQEQLTYMFNNYLTDPTDVVTLMLPQYNAVPY